MSRKRLLIIFLLTLVGVGLFIWWLAQKPVPEEITYGMSFNVLYAKELGLDWQETYDAIIGELGVRQLRLAAHWPMVEPKQGEFNFTELDYQIARAEAVGAEIILGVGRRLPRWPECHVPSWVSQLPEEVRAERQLQYITAVVERYRDSSAVKVWQVENEPFLSAFAYEHCGPLDVAFLDREIELVRSLDGSRPILVTDSGNLGTWYGAYQRGDIFGTSVYVHFWNPELGQFRTFLPPWFYRAKERIMALRYGEKPTYLIELSAEPWLLDPIVEVPLDVQYSRMDIEKFIDIVEYARETRYDRQYLWGAEWWYWLKQQGDDSFWEMGKTLFVDDTLEALE
jgi:hypothetical protein